MFICENKKGLNLIYYLLNFRNQKKYNKINLKKVDEINNIKIKEIEDIEIIDLIELKIGYLERLIKWINF